MAKLKEKRNQQFIKAWKIEQLSNKELQEKFNLSPGGVKGLKARLRKKDPSLYKTQTKKKDFSPQPTSTTPQTSTSTKRMTFWLFKDMIKKIKVKAVKERKTSSEIARELFSKYL